MYALFFLILFHFFKRGVALIFMIFIIRFCIFVIVNLFKIYLITKMSNTYTQIYVQAVFAVNKRQNFINESLRIELEKIISTIIKDHQSKLLAIYCNPDHTHVFFGLHPACSVSKIVEAIKSGSSGWINREKKINGKFSWQSGFGAFTYSKSQIDNVVKYILNQPVHHKRNSFKEEYLDFLKKFEIEYNEQFLFDWME